jgi:hypothetical protein
MAKSSTPRRVALALEALETRQLPSTSPLNPTGLLYSQHFDTATRGSLPAGWSQWRSPGGSSNATPFAVSAAPAVSGHDSLTATAAPGRTARAWVNATQPADVSASVDVYVDSLVPAQLFVRGSGLNTAAPSYYAVSVTRGLQVQLLRVVNGQSVTLGTRSSADYLTGRWVQVTLSVAGSSINVQVYRLDTHQYLNSAGRWQSGQAWALSRTDSQVSGPGKVGLVSPPHAGGGVRFDDLIVADNLSPSLAVSGLPSNKIVSRTTTVEAGVTDNDKVSRVVFSIDGVTRGTDSSAPYTFTLNPATLGNGAHTLLVQAVDRAGNSTVLPLAIATTASRPNTRPARDSRSPTVRIDTSVSGRTLSAITTIQVRATDNVKVERVQFYLDGALQNTDFGTPYAWTLDPNQFAAGQHTLVVRAYDTSNNQAQTSVSFYTRKSGPTDSLSITQHYSWIRLAELAYGGTPLSPFEQQLLKNSIDLVVANASYFSTITKLSPGTPRLVYTNVDNIYLGLLTDWDHYADSHGYNRESAFYHVTHATRISGDSPSSVPVDWFWAVLEGGGSAVFNDLTTLAHSPQEAVQFGGASTSMYIGFPEKFNQINVALASPASDGWSGVWQYADQVDANGTPTHWANLPLKSDGTRGFTRSGQVAFDPPAGWKAGTVDGSGWMYYVRFLTVNDGTPPVANTIEGDDYIHAAGTTSGVIPAFDYALDANHDGYLTDAEYARAVREGYDARFAYQSRLFYGYYGQMRFQTNPSSPQFDAWAVDYSRRLLANTPYGSGLFVDNSSGRFPLPDADVREDVSTYSDDYGALLNAIGRAIAPRWLMANTSGGQYDADGIIRQNTAYFEEFALRPLASNFTQFEDLANLIAHREALKSPAPYAVLDSLPTGGSPTDARTQITTLAEYYLLADSKHTFLDFFGGYEPSSSWARHFSKAVTFNVGQPQGSWSLFATGSDPNNSRLTYHIYERNYSNALVLYKPLSYSATLQVNGALGGRPTTEWLGGTYRQLRADGTLGPPITTISLHNGEGAILIRA